MMELDIVAVYQIQDWIKIVEHDLALLKAKSKIYTWIEYFLPLVLTLNTIYITMMSIMAFNSSVYIFCGFVNVGCGLVQAYYLLNPDKEKKIRACQDLLLLLHNSNAMPNMTIEDISRKVKQTRDFVYKK